MAVVPRRRENFALGACLATDNVGDLVYVRGLFTGTRYRVERADPSDSLKMPAVAVIVSKQTPTACTIMFYGMTSLYSGLTPGEAYVVGTDGRPAKLGDPNYPGSGYIVQQIGVATDDDEMLIRPMDAAGDSGSVGNRYYQQLLISTIDPKIFTTVLPFKHGGVETEVILYNGQRLRSGGGHDYVVSASGGYGLRYDTITLEFDPRPNSNWFIDYVPDL
jgi:hypothetical protein